MSKGRGYLLLVMLIGYGLGYFHARESYKPYVAMNKELTKQLNINSNHISQLRELNDSVNYLKDKFSQKLTVTATAYSNDDRSIDVAKWRDGITSSGMVARVGIIAVDPRVIPIGKSVYVPGWGVHYAADTGGAIKGNKIDIFFDTEEEALQFGRRKIDIYF